MAKNNKNLIVGLDIGTSSVKTIIALINEDNEGSFSALLPVFFVMPKAVKMLLFK